MPNFSRMKFTLLCFFALVAGSASRSTHVAATAQKPSTPIQFVDVTAAAGIKWNLKVLAPGAKYLIETMGGGGGFIDYNSSATRKRHNLMERAN